MSSLRTRPRVRKIIGHDITVAEHEAIRAVNSQLRAIQVLFYRGRRSEACSTLAALVLCEPSETPSFAFCTIEVSRALCRATNNFDEPWHKDDPGYFQLENLELYNLFDDVLLSVLMDPLGYPFSDIYRVAPSAGDSWTGAGEFRPGYDDTDVQIRRMRLRALATEYGGDNNMSRDAIKALLGRGGPTIESDDARFSRFCTE